MVALSFFSENDLVREHVERERCRGEERNGSLQRSSAFPSYYFARKMARDPRECFVYSPILHVCSSVGSYDNS